MSRKNSIILGLLFVILVIEIIVLAPKELGISPAEDAPPAQVKPVAGNGAGQIMNDAHLVISKGEEKEWELWADKGTRPNEGMDWTIERVRVKFFAEGGASYTVTGKKGNVDPTKNDMRIQGNVVTRSSNGYVFKTESIFYDSKNRKLTSPTDVEMIGPPDKDGPGIQLTGTDLIADFASNDITINKNVKAKKHVKRDKVANIQSTRAEFNGRNNTARFFGNVVVDMDTMRITGPEAAFAYDRTTKALASVEVAGGVKVTDTNKFATSQKVSIHFTEDRVVFNGAPRVVQNGDELVGDEIIFLDGGRKVQVSNAKAQFDPNTVGPNSQPRTTN